MPTGEPNKLLERDLSRVAAKPITDIASPLLQELVNAGLMAFLRCEVEVADKGVENEDVAALILYRHMIEMVDGIQVLVLQSCGTAAIPLLRSEFEASMGLSYLLGDADGYLQRSLSWLVAHLHGAIKGRKVLDLSSQGGKEFAQFYQEEFGRVVPELSQPEIAAEIAAMERAPQNAQFSPIEAEYQRTKTLRNRSPEWFSLFDGPKNRAELAKLLGRGAEYRMCYGDWSSLGHVTSFTRYLSTLNAKPAFEAVRRPNELQLVSQMAAILLLRATREMIGTFRSGENLTPW